MKTSVNPGGTHGTMLTMTNDDVMAASVAGTMTDMMTVMTTAVMSAMAEGEAGASMTAATAAATTAARIVARIAALSIGVTPTASDMADVLLIAVHAHRDVVAIGARVRHPGDDTIDHPLARGRCLVRPSAVHASHMTNRRCVLPSLCLLFCLRLRHAPAAARPLHNFSINAPIAPVNTRASISVSCPLNCALGILIALGRTGRLHCR